MNIRKSKTSQPKCVLFDADGVIISAGEQMSQKYARKFGVNASDLAEFFTGPFSKCLIGKADLKEEIIPYLEKWGWEGSIDEFLSWWFDAEHNVDQRVMEVIRELKSIGIPVYLATNQEKYRGEYMKTEMRFDKLFDKVFVSSEIGHKKPDKDFFEIILAEIKKDCGADSTEVLFFDDSESHINGAKTIDINAHLYKNFGKDMLRALAQYWDNFKFDDWANQVKKIALSNRNKDVYIQHGDVWWNRFGKNVGFEQDGKGVDYSRPVVVIKKLSQNTFLGAPLTTADYEHVFRIDVGDFGGKKSKAIISQVRVFDKKRLEERVGRISKDKLNCIKKSIKDML